MNKQEAKQIGERNGYGAAIYTDGPCDTDRREAGCDCTDGNYCEDCLTQAAYESEQNARDFSPFEFTAHAINGSNDPEGLWSAYVKGVALGIKRGVAKRLQGDVRVAGHLQALIVGDTISFAVCNTTEHQRISGDVKSDYISRLFDDIERILTRDGKTLGNLARELDRSYNQVYDWVRMRKFNPRATTLLELVAWRDANLSSAQRVSAEQATTKTDTQELEAKSI